MRSYAETHPGTRAYNEDRFLDRPDLGLWAVADGAGGHQSGEVASGMIADALDAIPAGLDAPDEALLAEAARRGADATIASTAVILCVREGRYACLWAGDSRAYLLRARMLHCLTHDHSLVQELVDAGQITLDAAEGHPHANVVTRAVGAGGPDGPLLDKATDAVFAGDRFLLCSDGLTKSLAEADIAAVLAEGGTDVADRLIAAAVARQARDNVTVVVIDVAGDA
jgi:protein phosphatase/serine/threonine-protein phosphatase Stp1